ncbi:hypothetical protein Taro_040459 [Colocasia esculenta]|uniref:Uncharacterized protein n=1 Tax=Colocasia esculenta TaxID=4460 RepID=A0A843WJ45_COLES|nr:hypothetical protein [Colocasia esculenta]
MLSGSMMENEVGLVQCMWILSENVIMLYIYEQHIINISEMEYVSVREEKDISDWELFLVCFD